MSNPTETSAAETGGQPEHPDDAAVAEVRAWLEGAHDEDLIELEAQMLRGVLAVLDGWKRNAHTAAAQRNAAYSELDTVKVDMRMLRDDVAAATARAEKAEAELRERIGKTREQVADDIEAYAQSIGWYEGGGVWAEAIDVARTGWKADDGS